MFARNIFRLFDQLNSQSLYSFSALGTYCDEILTLVTLEYISTSSGNLIAPWKCTNAHWFAKIQCKWISEAMIIFRTWVEALHPLLLKWSLVYNGSQIMHVRQKRNSVSLRKWIKNAGSDNHQTNQPHHWTCGLRPILVGSRTLLSNTGMPMVHIDYEPPQSLTSSISNG